MANRFFTGRCLGSDNYSAVKATILDRIRVPTFLGHGAKRIDDLIDTTAIPPLIVIPLWLYTASQNLLLTLVSFALVPVCAVAYYLRILRNKKRTQFFMSWSLVSIFSMYYVFSQYAVPLGDISALEHAALTLNLFLFFGAFAMTKLGPGIVDRTKLSSPDVQHSQNSSEYAPNNFSPKLHKRTNSSSDPKSTDSQSHSVRTPLIGQDSLDAPKGTNDIQGQEAPDNWCDTCHLWKPDRAGHCRICGTCVHRLDHHCVWIDCCVGRDNHRSFMVSLLLFLGGGCYGALRAANILWTAVSSYTFWLALDVIFSERGNSIMFVSVLYASIACPAVLALLLQQFHLITHNWTYRERRLSLRQPGGRERLADLDAGFIANWHDFLCQSRVRARLKSLTPTRV